MFSQKLIFASTRNNSHEIEKLNTAIREAEAIVIGVGAGMSTAAGFNYSGPRFEKYFSDFKKKYGIQDMYSGGFFPFPTQEEFWAFWSRHIMVNRYDVTPGQPYVDLLEVVKGKDYFVLTTNVDHQFQLAGFDKARLFYTQGDYGLLQCKKPCHQKTYDNEEMVRKMYAEQKDMKIPTELIPKCPKCGGPMNTNLRCDDTFVEDEGWRAASKRYSDFLASHQDKRVLYLELGVGHNTPGIIKFPFWGLTAQNPKAIYACINLDDSYCNESIAPRSILIEGDLNAILHNLRSSQTPTPRPSST